MHRLTCALAVAALVGPVATARAAPADPAATELRAITQEMLDAIAPGKTEVWARYLDDHIVHVDENGEIAGKAELLSQLTPLPPGLVGRIEIASFQVETHGDVAVATHLDQEHLDYYGQPLASRFRTTDTWLRSPAGWKLIGEQTIAVLRDPPVMTSGFRGACDVDGRYRLAKDIEAEVRCGDEHSISSVRKDRPPAKWLPETPDVYFLAGEPRSRRIFQRDDAGHVTGFVDRREGEDIRWSRIAP